MSKSLINSRFSRHLEDYNKYADIQKTMADKLVKLCEKKHYNRILELGCGTGFLTERLINTVHFDNYTAIDIVNECEPYIHKINKNIEFQNIDIEEFNTEIPYDLIISNAALQWVDDFEKTINLLIQNLTSDGELIFSTFGKENFREICFISGISLKYYTENELQKMFPDAQIYPPEIYIKSFKTPVDVLKHLKLTGVNAIEKKFWTKSDLKNFEQAYSNLCSARPTLTYNPIYIKIRSKYKQAEKL